MWVVIGGSPYSLSSCPLPILPFLLSPTLLPHVFKAVKNQKRRKKKRHVCKGKEADGLAHGRTASLSRPQSGGAFLVFVCTGCGYNLLNSKYMTCSLLSLHTLPPLQIALECLIQAIHLPWTEGLTARPGSSGSG